MITDPNCLLCGEPGWGLIQARGFEEALPVVYTMEGPRYTHRECMLRETMGGIGHLIAHQYWCIERQDPDAGLTFRQSALMVDAAVNVLGVEACVNLSVVSLDASSEVPEPGQDLPPPPPAQPPWLS